MSMLQLFINLLVLSIVTQAYSSAVVDESSVGTIDNSTSTEVERSLGENVTIFNSTEDKPREAGGPSSLPLYQPSNIFSSGGQGSGASPLVAGPMGAGQGFGGYGAGTGAGQGFGGYGAGIGGKGYGGLGAGIGAGQGFGGYGAGIGGYGGLGAGKDKLGANFIPPSVGAPFPVYNGIGNLYLTGGGLFCEGCGGNLIIPPLPPIPPQIYPPTYTWREFPPLPPFPQIFTPAVAAYPPPIMPPPMQQDSSMGQQLLQNPGFGGMKGQSMQMPGQSMQQNIPMMGQQESSQQLQGQNIPMMGQQGLNQHMQGQNLPILGQQGLSQQMGQAMQGNQ